MQEKKQFSLYCFKVNLLGILLCLVMDAGFGFIDHQTEQQRGCIRGNIRIHTNSVRVAKEKAVR